MHIFILGHKNVNVNGWVDWIYHGSYQMHIALFLDIKSFYAFRFQQEDVENPHLGITFLGDTF